MFKRKSAIILLLIILLLTCLNTSFAKARATLKLNYEVSPIVENNVPKLKITLTFQGDKSGKTEIKLPDEFAGQNELYKGIQNLKILTPNAKLNDIDKPQIKKLEFLPNQKIVIEYYLVQDWEGNPRIGSASFNAGGGYRPVVKNDYFHFLGFGGWVFPNVSKDAKIKVSIDWKDLPKNWTLANSFGANQSKQNFSTDIGSFESSIFVGGEYRLGQRLVKGKPVFMALRGKWDFSDDDFNNLVGKVVEIEREFWNDHKHPYFLVTLLPLEGNPESFSIGGTGLTNSFATFIKSGTKLNDITSLLSHEYFHNWNSNAFGGMKDPEALLYWFSEGFTDYYTFRLLVRSGLFDLEKYVAQYNEFLTDYYLSPVRNEDSQRILQDFFKDYAVSKLPYRRGFLLATKWNEIIRQQSNGAKSLDDVMRNILHDAKKGQFKQLTKEYIISVLSKYAKYDFAADIEKYAEKGETIGGFDGVLGNCVDNFETKMGKFEIGFDFESARKDKTAAKVIKDSTAYEAGLRDGQKILRSSVYFGNTKMPVELTVEENGQKRKISYLPETKEKIGVPQFKLKENLSEAEKKGCLSKF